MAIASRADFGPPWSHDGASGLLPRLFQKGGGNAWLYVSDPKAKRPRVTTLKRVLQMVRLTNGDISFQFSGLRMQGMGFLCPNYINITQLQRGSFIYISSKQISKDDFEQIPKKRFCGDIISRYIERWCSKSPKNGGHLPTPVMRTFERAVAAGGLRVSLWSRSPGSPGARSRGPRALMRKCMLK